MPTIRLRGDKWQSIVRVKRGGVIIHQEARSFTTEKLARSWGLGVEARIAQGGVPQRQLAQKTLSELLLDYAEVLGSHSNNDRTRNRLNEMGLLAREFGTPPIRLADISANTFVSFAKRRRAEGAGAATVLHNLASVRAVLNMAKPLFKLDITGDAVAEAIGVLGRLGLTARSRSRERRPTDDELARLSVEFRRTASYPSSVLPMAEIAELAVVFPRRLGELLDMKWADYNKRTRLVTLRDTKHPTKPRDEIVPVGPAARRIIDRLPVTDERILPYKSDSASMAFARACARLGIEDLHFHDLRHEGISRLFEQGLAIQEVAIVSGHQNWAMLKRYTHPSVTALSDKLNLEELPGAGI